MFILKREEVEIVNVKHPSQERKIPILKYNNQTFRLINVFPAEKAEEAINAWRDLADNQHKFCILLEETERYSVWGKIKLKQDLGEQTKEDLLPLIQASILILQTVYLDIEDLFGSRQAERFIEEITGIFREGKFPEIDSQQTVKNLLKMDPLDKMVIPSWQENHLSTLLEELHRLGKDYFGNTNFATNIQDILLDLPTSEQQSFISWLHRTSLGKLWQ